MIIKREEKEYTLTSEELYQAYWEQQHIFRLADAESQLSDFISSHFISDAQFKECFGFSRREVCDPTSSYYLLEKFLASYEKHHDCELAENDVWQECVRNILLENACNAQITYSANYSLYDPNVPGGNPSKRVTELFSPEYPSVEDIEKAENAYLAHAFERHGIRNGKVIVMTSIKEIRTVGKDQNNASFRDWLFKKAPWMRKATMVDGKLVFDEEGTVE